MSLLKSLKSPSELHDFTDDQLVRFAAEVRDHLLDSVSQSGGHFASNLGVVELTVALHAVFDTPKDKLIWDVSHQIYPHKIITGRAERMTTIRQRHGLSGFAAPTESEYDVFLAAHASTSISAALGLACASGAAGASGASGATSAAGASSAAGANTGTGEKYKVVTVTGDGAMTGGLCYEGLNHLGSTRKDVLIVLNDNRWAISKTVGALSRYLTNIMTDERYNKLRKELWELTGRFKRREKIRETVRRLERSFKTLVSPGSLFEHLGLRYFGPIDGNDLPLLRKTLTELKALDSPRVLHILTKKGAGYAPAEEDALKYYAVSPFDRKTGEFHPKAPSNPAYTTVFGDALVELGERNESLNVITAAMPTGSGVLDFGEKFPERYYDVGIAEEHATCFSAGLAAGGVRPLLAVYSSFMQRAYDQMIHDIALQNLPVVVCMDRAGLVGADGPTHHGTFDISYMQTIPNVTICVPKDGDELRSMMRYAVEEKITGPITLRYPRGSVPAPIHEGFAKIDWGRWEALREGESICVLACGTMVDNTLKAAELALKETGRNVTVVNARFIKPLDESALLSLAGKHEALITVEENSLMGGFGSTISRRMHEEDYSGRVINLGLPDRFIPHGSIDGLWKEIGLDPESISVRIVDALNGQKAG
ncbi:MAG: 1-deoxy-D-xylulose-5-phosphate synthase, partial [Candidatus Zixiibacteriota bacterium]